MFILQVNSVQCVEFGVARWYIVITPTTMMKNPLWGNFILSFCFLIVETKSNVLFMLAFDRKGGQDKDSDCAL